MTYEATFAVSLSEYMDNELGLEYMRQHFEPYTRDAIRRVGGVVEGVVEGSEAQVNHSPWCLIVDDHSSHVSWQVVKYVLDHNIHMICLPSKSTHLLQPLDVSCFSLLQTTYERNLSIWLRNNPLSAISKPDFLNILQQTRREVFTTANIESAWRAAHCWPIDCRHLHHYQDKSSAVSSAAV